MPETLIAIPEKSKEEFVNLTRQIVSGKLAGTIFHKAKNILMPLTGYAELIEEGVSEDKQKKYLKKIENAGQTLQLLLKNFLRFSRTLQENAEEEIDISELIENVISLFEHYLIQAKIKLEKDIHIEKEKAWGVYDDISLILASVLLNAVEALTPGGIIRLGAEVFDNKIRVFIYDNGQGISEEVRDKIFEAFFTTKRGSLGIGLTASLFLARNMSGDLVLEDKNRFILSLAAVPRDKNK